MTTGMDIGHKYEPYFGIILDHVWHLLLFVHTERSSGPPWGWSISQGERMLELHSEGESAQPVLTV